jgi:hypothetical protein
MSSFRSDKSGNEEFEDVETVVEVPAEAPRETRSRRFLFVAEMIRDVHGYHPIMAQPHDLLLLDRPEEFFPADGEGSPKFVEEQRPAMSGARREGDCLHSKPR